MIKVVDANTVSGNAGGKPVDYDYYLIEFHTAMATKEVTVCVGFADEDDNRISGDIIAYGEWGQLEVNDCKEYLIMIKNEGKMIRDYTQYL